MNTETPPIKVNPAFDKFLPPLEVTELAMLKASILADGVREPITVWRQTGDIIDGHNRHRIATQNDLLYQVKYLDFIDEDGVFKWMIENQASRRNWTPQNRALFIGKVYNKLVADGTGNAAEMLADQFGESPRNVKRHGKLEKSIEQSKAEGRTDVEEKFLAKKISAAEIVKEFNDAKSDNLSPEDPEKGFLKAVAAHADKLMRKISELKTLAEDLDTMMLTKEQNIREYAPNIASLHAQLNEEYQEAATLKTLVAAPAGHPQRYITKSQFSSLTAQRAA